MPVGRSQSIIPLASRRRARDQRIVAGVDIGASKAACFIAQYAGDDDDHLDAEIIGVGFHGARMRVGAGLSVDDMELGLRRAVDAAERMAGVRVHNVRVAAPGRIVHARRIGVDLEIADGVVTQEDIEDSLRAGAKIAAAPDCAMLSASPIAYSIDAESLYDDPVGHAGSILSTELLGLSARASAVDNLASLLERCGLTAQEITPAPIAAADSVLIEDEKELGVILIDIGAASTDFAVYEDGAVVQCGGVPIGGAHITKDIAQIFGAPLVDAERIKTLHGAALIGTGDEHRFIDFPQLGDGAETNRVSRADLCEVIIPRMEEIFDMAAGRIMENERRKMSVRRVVITGGGSLLLGAREIAEKAFAMKARVGRPLSLVGAPEAGAAPGFSVCAGLVQGGSKSGSFGKFSLGVQNQSRHAIKQSAFLSGPGAWLRAKF